jgi:hypothetical protein
MLLNFNLEYFIGTRCKAFLAHLSVLPFTPYTLRLTKRGGF